MTRSNTDYTKIPIDKDPTAQDVELAKRLYFEAYCYSDWRGMMSYHGIRLTQPILRWVHEQEKLEHTLN